MSVLQDERLVGSLQVSSEQHERQTIRSRSGRSMSPPLVDAEVRHALELRSLRILNNQLEEIVCEVHEDFETILAHAQVLQADALLGHFAHLLHEHAQSLYLLHHKRAPKQ